MTLVIGQISIIHHSCFILSIIGYLDRFQLKSCNFSVFVLFSFLNIPLRFFIKNFSLRQQRYCAPSPKELHSFVEEYFHLPTAFHKFLFVLQFFNWISSDHWNANEFLEDLKFVLNLLLYFFHNLYFFSQYWGFQYLIFRPDTLASQVAKNLSEHFLASTTE